MRSLIATLSGIALLGLAPDSLSAQFRGPVVTGPWYHGGGGWGWGNAGWGLNYQLPPGNYGGQTAFSAEAQGMAELLRAQGELNQANAAARRDLEAARGQYIENQEQWLQVYREHQRQGEERRAERQAADRERTQRHLSAMRQRQPELLGRSEFDPATGTLVFPTALQDPTFDEGRQRLQDLFAIRARSGVASDSSEEIARIASDMLAVLKVRLELFSPPDYIAARSFLERVRNEGMFGQ